MSDAGDCPGSAEESAPVSDAVVAIQDRVGDHAGPGEAPGDLAPYELTGEQCVELAAVLRLSADVLSRWASPGDPDPAWLRRWADTLTEAIE